MRSITVLGMVLMSGMLVAAGENARTFTFTKSDEGKLPRGWKADKTGEGAGSVWKVVADATAPSKKNWVLAQTADGPSRLFNLCVVEDASLKDLDIAVHLRSVQGVIDQGGGVVWRYKDANNYYVCRYNPLEENLRVYKVVDGKRTQLQSKENLPSPAGQWRTLSVTHVGDRIECSLDGKRYLAVTDDTFKEAGKVGLWTKADAVTHFDGFTAKAR